MIISQPFRQRYQAVVTRLSPRRHMHRLRRWLADSLPRSFRLWYCVRAADNEDDPEFWSQVLRFLMNRRLGIAAQVPMSQLAAHIIEIHPGADTDSVNRLLQQLESAIFGHSKIEDFKLWKYQFKQQIRPNLFNWLRKRALKERHKLPALNPVTR